MLAIVESPYQLQNVISLFEVLDIDTNQACILIRDNGNEVQKEQFSAHLSNVRVKFFFLPSKGNKKIFYFIFIMLYVSFFFIKNKQVALGDVRSIVCKPYLYLARMFKKKVYLVDDGLYLMKHVTKIRSFPCTIYTSLPLEAGRQDLFSVIKKSTKHFKSYDKERSLSFIGQHLVELDFINSDDFFTLLVNIKNVFASKYDKFNYYAHRSESSNKLAEIERLGFNVLKLESNIEHYFHNNNAPQGVFISFYSTALLNIFNAHAGDEFYFYDEYLIIKDPAIKESISLCYETLKKAGIKKLSLN
ncbi:hypothetical protein [Colwellia sp. BRX9-1]|uniref:hypothetical protein n=1 Tax=Colwellia sp. BRX9-1 TaxID=2759830 RepID=UPI0015F7279D|nr:hypothetical protein [Colwellia sp. BRX9-1]MBA6353599.1 hypothetical protein [Colwellia sp. BRX9-1]